MPHRQPYSIPTVATQSVSPFIRLPPELRNKIYFHIFSGHEIYTDMPHYYATTTYKCYLKKTPVEVMLSREVNASRSSGSSRGEQRRELPWYFSTYNKQLNYVDASKDFRTYKVKVKWPTCPTRPTRQILDPPTPTLSSTASTLQHPHLPIMA